MKESEKVIVKEEKKNVETAVVPIPEKQVQPKPSFFSKFLCCSSKQPKEEDDFSNVLPPVGKYQQDPKL